MQPALLALCIVGCVALAGDVYALRAKTMDTPQVHISSFEVVGIEARTTNAREMTADGVIGPMWARVAQEKLLEKIPGKLSSDVIALYFDYESNKDGAYTYLLGVKVSSANSLPPEFARHKVPAGAYAEYRDAGASAAKVTVGLWQKVWSLEASHTLRRAYRTDFEIHPATSPNGAESRVSLYVGLRD